MMKAELFCDGASRGNPGSGAYGFVILSGGDILHQGAAVLGTVTNNEAEYQGLIEGLKAASTKGVTELTVKSDSELMVRQLNGQYKVKSPNLFARFEEAKSLLKNFKKVQVTHVRREENKLADALANRALDEAKAGVKHL